VRCRLERGTKASIGLGHRGDDDDDDDDDEDEDEDDR
jgi:hypothetical protein